MENDINYNPLNEALIDVARGIYGRPLVDNIVLDNTVGPNNWDSITADDFGPRHDFEVDDHGSIFILTPVSEAALQWCYAHLPEDAPRWGSVSYAIEPRYIEDIVRGCQRDGLLSEDDYVEAMQEVELQNAQAQS